MLSAEFWAGLDGRRPASPDASFALGGTGLVPDLLSSTRFSRTPEHKMNRLEDKMSRLEDKSADPSTWEQARKLSESFGVDYNDLRAFLLASSRRSGGVRALVPEFVRHRPVHGPSGRTRDVKCNEEHKENKSDRRARELRESKKRALLALGDAKKGLFLDNKHGDGDKSSSTTAPRGAGTVDEWAASVFNPSMYGDDAYVDGLAADSVGRNSDPDDARSRSSGSSSGDTLSDAALHPEDSEHPNHGALYGGAAAHLGSGARPLLSTVLSAQSFTSESRAHEESGVEKNAQVYVDGNPGILQISAGQSVLSKEALALMKRSYYRQRLSRGWGKRHMQGKRTRGARGDYDNQYPAHHDTTTMSQPPRKRARDESHGDKQVVQPAFSEALLHDFASRIVGCPLCRHPSRVGHRGNLRC